MGRYEANTAEAHFRLRDDAPPIPEVEIQNLALVLADARDWAQQGKPSLGYAMLLRGFIQAERHVLDERPWARALVAQWREAIDRFSRVYDPQLEE
jgi:hypothetical protein